MILHYEIHYDIDSNTYEKYCCSCFNVVTGKIHVNDTYYNANEYFMDWSICDDCSCKYCMNRTVSSVAVCDIKPESDYDFSDCKDTRKEIFGFIAKKNWDVFQSIVIPVAVTALYIVFMVVTTICRTVDDNKLQTWDVIRVTSLVLTFYNILSSVFCHFGLFLRFILHMKTISTKDGINPQCLVSPVKILPIMIVEGLIIVVLLIVFEFPVLIYFFKICSKQYNCHKCQKRIAWIVQILGIISIILMVGCEILMITLTFIAISRILDPDAHFVIYNNIHKRGFEIVGIIAITIYAVFGWLDIFCCKFCHYSTKQIIQRKGTVLTVKDPSKTHKSP